MKRLLYINWYDEDSVLHDIHYKCLKQYNTLFDEIFVVINTKNRHNITKIHDIKNSFDEIFNNRVSFRIEQIYDNQENNMFETYFLPLLDKYPNEYSVVYYIHDSAYDLRNYLNEYNMFNLKLWTAANYYFNFKNIDEHLDALLNKDYVITGGLHYKYKIDYGNCSVNEFFPGAFYGISIVNLLKLYNSISLPERYKTFVEPEVHFFTFVPEDKVFGDTDINTISIPGKYMPMHCKIINECNNIIRFNTHDDDYDNLLKIVNDDTN